MQGDAVNAPSGFLGRTRAADQVREFIRRAARVDCSVLITGESGVGKELVAREIHDGSARGDKIFFALNCSAIPESLFESEVFGHEAGAFTGAHGERRGAFELSQGGTLFLDEIGDLSLTLQPKLLRVLDSGEFCRVGGEHTRPLNVRVIAATSDASYKEVLQREARRLRHYDRYRQAVALANGGQLDGARKILVALRSEDTDQELSEHVAEMLRQLDERLDR